MHAHFVLHRNALCLHQDSEKELIGIGQTVHELLIAKSFLHEENGEFKRVGPFIPFLNGQPVLQAEWNTVLRENDVVQVVRMPKGGGGGSNIGNIIAGVVAAALAYFTFGASLLVTAAVGIGVAVGMSLLTGAIAAPRAGSMGGRQAGSSPTYSLKAQSNEARLLEAIPRVYGTMRTVPDLAAQPYSEFVGNEQILYQLFAVSLGDVDIDAIYIDETPIANFDDAQYQIVRPGEKVTLFPDNVITSDAVQTIELPTPGTVPVNIIGPYVVSASQKLNKLAVDIAFPRGIGRIDDQGNDATHSVRVTAQYRQVGTNDWLTLSDETVTGTNQTPIFKTYSIDVPEGIYEVQMFKATGTITENRQYDTAQWVSLRGYINSITDYGDMTLVATRMVATNSLNSTTARRFYVTSTSKLQTWDPVDGWGPRVRTNSIAWAAADILRDPNYGRGLPTSRLNMANLYRLHNTWEARNDKFNGVFDSKTQLWEALSIVVRCGRTTPVYYAGQIDFVRDEPATIITAQYTPGLMVRDSFNAGYKFHSSETPDHVIVEYTNPDTWKPAEVACGMPGSPMINPYRVKMPGVTNRDQAYREGMSMAASNRDRRRTIEFTTLKGGLIPEYNGLIRVQHDVPQWGFYGRVISLDVDTGAIVTSEPIPDSESINTLIAFRKRDGSEDGPYVFEMDPNLNPDAREFGGFVRAPKEQLEAIYIADGYNEDYTQYIAGPSDRRGIKCLVTGCRPDGEGRVAITAINYADSVHTAENGGNPPPPPPESNLPNIEGLPVVDKVEVLYTVTVGEQNIVASVGRPAIYYEFQARATGTNWINLGTADQPFMRANLSPGQWSVRVRGVGRAPGAWSTWDGNIEATSLPTPSLTSFTGTPKLFAIGLSWTYDVQTASICKRIEIRQGVTDVFNTSTPLIELPYPANAYTFDNLGPAEARYLWARCIDTAGRPGPWFNNGAGLRFLTSADYDKVTDALLGKIGEEQLTQDLIEKIETPDVDLTPLWTAINLERTERIDSDTALTQQVNTAMSKANDSWALAQTNQTTIAKTNGDLAAMYTIKTQITSNGITHIAGIGVGVENTGGIVSSSVTMVADKLVLLNPNTNTIDSPFMVVAGNTYIKSAFIQQATITNALIGATLTSVATVGSGANAGLPVLTINFSNGQTVYRGVGFSRVDSSIGTYMQDVVTGVKVLEWGDI